MLYHIRSLQSGNCVANYVSYEVKHMQVL